MKDLRESICALCGADIVNAMLDYRVYIEDIPHPVCGRCFILTKILDKLEGEKDGNNRRSGLQIPDGDVH